MMFSYHNIYTPVASVASVCGGCVAGVRGADGEQGGAHAVAPTAGGTSVGVGRFTLVRLSHTLPEAVGGGGLACVGRHAAPES